MSLSICTAQLNYIVGDLAGNTQKILAAAEQAYAQARALGLPATRVLPYQAQLAFERRDYAQARALMRELHQWGALPRLRPVIDYWNHS